LPTELGSVTKCIAPIGVKCFTGFNSKFLLDCVGDRMLEIVKKYEPEATMQTVKMYNLEIAKAIRSKNLQ